MDFHQLRYFNSLAVLENMSKAASLLNISQSTLSKSISKLEEEMGCSLFTRNGKNIKLNSSGKMFFEYSVKVLDMLDSGVRISRNVQFQDAKRVKVCISGACNDIVKCIGEYNNIHPEVDFDIDGILDYEDVPDINNYDVMVCPDSPKYEVYEGTRISNNHMCLCVSASHPLADKLAVGLSDLDGLDMVFLKSGDAIESTQWGLEALSIKPNKVYYVNNRDIHRQIISEGLAAGFVLDGIRDMYQSNTRIKIIPVLDNRFSISMKIVFRREYHLSEEAKDFKDFVIQYLKKNQKDD